MTNGNDFPFAVGKARVLVYQNITLLLCVVEWFVRCVVYFIYRIERLYNLNPVYVVCLLFTPLFDVFPIGF